MIELYYEKMDAIGENGANLHVFCKDLSSANAFNFGKFQICWSSKVLTPYRTLFFLKKNAFSKQTLENKMSITSIFLLFEECFYPLDGSLTL